MYCLMSEHLRRDNRLAVDAWPWTPRHEQDITKVSF